MFGKILSIFGVGDRVEMDHPVTGKPETATITTFTADGRGRTDGVMVKFDDGGYIEVPIGRLEPTAKK